MEGESRGTKYTANSRITYLQHVNQEIWLDWLRED
jgi:hypothetical protein